jgi:phospholipid/cholesterol/gamma-HCH transport system substrate-binding protein
MSGGPRRHTAVLGLFVAVAVLTLGATILTIGDLHDTFTRKLGVSAVFTEVSGLQAGDNVWFAGVKVGVVKRLDLQAADAVEVSLLIDREAARFLPLDVVARIGSDGLIGSRIVVLSGGTPGGPRATEGAVLLVEPTLSTDDIMATMQENNLNLLAITTDVKALTASLAAGEGTVGRLLKEDALYGKIDATVDDTRATVASARAFSAGLGREGHLPNQLITDQTLYPSLSASAKDLQLVAQRSSALVDGLERGLGDAGTPAGTLLHDREAGADLKTVLSNLTEGSELLAEDLEAAQHNFLLRGFFRKAERKAASEAEATTEPGRH